MRATSPRHRRYGLRPPALSRQTEGMGTPSDTVDASTWYTSVTFLILNRLWESVPPNGHSPGESTQMDRGLFLLESLPDLAVALGVQRATLLGHTDSVRRIQNPCCAIRISSADRRRALLLPRERLPFGGRPPPEQGSGGHPLLSPSLGLSLPESMWTAGVHCHSFDRLLLRLESRRSTYRRSAVSPTEPDRFPPPWFRGR